MQISPLTADSFKNICQGIGALITALALVVSGVIFLWKREWRARVQLSVDIESFTRLADAFLVEPVCIVENRGLLRCYVYRLGLSVRYLMQGDHLVAGDERLLGATDFPHSAVKVDLVKPEWRWSYIEAGIRQRYSYVTHLPDTTVALLLGRAVP
jgi:hypothetical protein